MSAPEKPTPVAQLFNEVVDLRIDAANQAGFGIAQGDSQRAFFVGARDLTYSATHRVGNTELVITRTIPAGLKFLMERSVMPPLSETEPPLSSNQQLTCVASDGGHSRLTFHYYAKDGMLVEEVGSRQDIQRGRFGFISEGTLRMTTPLLSPQERGPFFLWMLEAQPIAPAPTGQA